MFLIKRSFWVYFVVGVVTTILSTILLYVGREWFYISLVVLNPLITLLTFFLKYYLYEKGKMIKEEIEEEPKTKPCMCQTMELGDR